MAGSRTRYYMHLDVADKTGVLARVAELTEGRSVVANLEIIRRDALTAARIAVALAELG